MTHRAEHHRIAELEAELERAKDATESYYERALTAEADRDRFADALGKMLATAGENGAWLRIARSVLAGVTR